MGTACNLESSGSWCFLDLLLLFIGDSANGKIICCKYEIFPKKLQKLLLAGGKLALPVCISTTVSLIFLECSVCCAKEEHIQHRGAEKT
jgi:hypothetical protein